MNRRAYGRAVVMIFAINVAAIALRSYAEAAFLASYGAKWIPILLVSQAVAFAIGTLAYDAITGRAPSATVDVALGLGLTVAAAVAPTLIAQGGAWPFVVTLTTTTLASVANVALWNTVAASVAGRDARRMLPRAGAAITGGGALAGFAAAAATTQLGASSVPWLSAMFAIIAVVAAIGAQRALASGGAPGMAAPPGASPELSVDHHALLRWLAVAAIAESAVATALEFRFGVALKASWNGGDLATAVSLFHGGTHAIQLVLQALVIPRLLTSQRLPVTVSIHPALTAIGAAVLVAVPGFAPLAVLRTGEKVLRSATARTGQEVSLSALPPAPRARWKILLRGLFTPIGAALAALVLVGFGPGVLARPVRFGAAVIGATLILAYAVRRGARRFVAALAAPLGMRGVAIGDRARERVELDELRRLIDATGDADGALARAALVRAGGRADDVSGYFAHDEAAVRRALYAIAARRPHPAATAELAAAMQIEDDDDARCAGLAALAAHGARDAIAELDADAVVDPDVARAIRAAQAEVGLATDAERAAVVTELVSRDGAWAARIARLRATAGYDDAVLAALNYPEGLSTNPPPSGRAPMGPPPDTRGPGRAQALIAATAAGGPALTALLDALVDGDRDAAAAVAALEDREAAAMIERLAHVDRVGRAALARARAAAPHPGLLLERLAADVDVDVRAAALRSLTSHARAGHAPSTALAEACMERERAALAALVAARAAGAPALHADELARALRRATRRLVLAVALATAAAGRDPLPLLAAGRRMLDAPDAMRRRALDLFQEVATAPLPVLDLLEAALRPPVGAGDRSGLAAVDPWLAELLAGRLAAHEERLAAVRQCRFFDELAGDHADELAAAAPRRTLASGDALMTAGEPGDELHVVLRGAVVGPGATPARFGPGAVLGELALIDDAPRAMTLTADGEVDVLVIDRATFARTLARWPELGGALLRTLATRT